MYKIKVPATSANLGSGFDVMGIAFDLFNEYAFEECEGFYLDGFAERYLDLTRNLVLSSYRRAFEFLNIKLRGVKITELSSGIPRSGGLGSSAACVVAGLLGANYALNGRLTKSDMFKLACEIEGYPDNVASAIYGGLNASYKTADGYKTVPYKVSGKLRFMLCIPDFFVSTKRARQVLPKTIDFRLAVENSSRIVNLPRAFESGDIEMLKDCVKDNFHEPYRIKLIRGAPEVKAAAALNGAIAVISGSGAAMLLIANKENDLEWTNKLSLDGDWRFVEVRPYFLTEDNNE